MFSLVADYSATSSSSDSENSNSSDHEEQDKPKITPTPSTSKPQLPSANLLLNQSSKSTGVVFSNPFLEAEKAEIDRLQKHVKMVESEEHMVVKNGRKICWNNRKGRCRFGNKCKYAHVSDLVDGGGSNAAEDKDSTSKSEKPKPPSANATVVKSPQLGFPQFDATNEGLKGKSRKRPGLGDKLEPGKKVLKQYEAAKLNSLS